MQIPLSSFLESPESWENQEIALRGFLYQKEGKTLLALEPNIPSCCLGKKPVLTLQGDFQSLPSHATLVQGIVINGEMQSAKMIEEPSYLKESAILFLLACVFAVLWKPLKGYFKTRFR